MSTSKGLSSITVAYLYRFHEILEDMIAGMTGAELTDSISHNFIVQMIPHHMAAIEMCRSLLQYTTCLPLQNIAANIITAQTKSIADMRAALPKCASLTNTRQDLCRYQAAFQEITAQMFSRMRGAGVSNNINTTFMRQMIPHHQGAIRMSENALRFPICPELVSILDAIITSQRRGVRQMEQLLRCI